jgi:alcohol dehydrogenase
MYAFEFQNPVHIIFGPGEVRRVGNEAAKLGTKALLVTYKNVDILADLVTDIIDYLRSAGVETVPFFGVSPNPKMSEVAAGLDCAKAAAVDLVIGLGGGSTMDTAKMIAAGFFYEGDLWNMVFSRHDNSQTAAPPTKALPLLMVPTLPATGSEMNPTAVITNERTTEKSYTWNACLYPKVSIVDPILTCSLPKYQTACAAADTISHVLEFHLTGFDHTPLNNRIQEGIMLTVIENVQKVLQDPNDVMTRGTLQWASILALNGISQPGDGWTPMHQLAHVISACYDVPHGAALSIIMPAWMKHFYKTRLERYAQFAMRVMDVKQDSKSLEVIALEGILRFENFLETIGVPTYLEDVGIGAEAVPHMAADVSRISFGSNGTLRSRPPATRQDVETVFELALKRGAK